jgi:hypothetical protein
VLALERSEIERVDRALERLARPVGSEVRAARAVWPQLAGGLPHSDPVALQRGIAAADFRARGLRPPSSLTDPDVLTGPAANIDGLLLSYVALSQRGWHETVAALGNAKPTATAGARGHTPAAVGFLRANLGLYVYCVYDGHYDLSMIGKLLARSYRTLGGPAAFGDDLTQTEVDRLADDYSVAAVQLQPHPAHGVHV